MQHLVNGRSALLKNCSCFFLLALASLHLPAQNPANPTNPGIRDTVTKAIVPTYGSDEFYIVYAGAAYSIVKYRSGKRPYAASHTIGINYSPILNSLHPFYEGLFPQVLGNWDLAVKAGYDGLRRMNYFGLGNETREQSTNNRFNWMRTRHQYASLGISRLFANHHTIDIGVSYDGIQVLNDKNRFIAKDRRTIDPADFDWQNFLSGRLNYTYSRLNYVPFPTKGIRVTGSASYTESLKRGGHSFSRYTTDFDTYFPLSSTLSLALRGGAATLNGNPDFYQYNNIGGGSTLRGYRRWRYYGKTSFYNQNELRWLRGVERGNVYGHFGIVAHYDQGRVWQPGESSDKLHFGYGAGVIVAPFDKIWMTAVYSISNEDRIFHFAVQAAL